MVHKQVGVAAAAVALLTLAAGCGGGGSTSASSGSGGSGGGKSTSGMTISLSNSYAGNTWRQQMLQEWNKAGSDAKSKNLVKEAPVVNSNNSASQQSSQIDTMILQGVNAIVIDAASTTALNGVIQKACNAHIVVVTFDALATAPCAYKVAFDYVNYGKFETDYVNQRLNGHGNLLEIRGIAGTSVDDDIHKGIMDSVQQNPGLKVVSSVHGNWTESIAQREIAGVLPSLPNIDAVVDQGGDGYGAAQAFLASGRPLPIIVMGNRADELQFWYDQHQKNGYQDISISSQPGVSSIAFWVAQQILAGAKVPKQVTVPLLTIKYDDLKGWLDATPAGGVATPYYDLDWTKKLITAANTGGSAPPQPLPKGVSAASGSSSGSSGSSGSAGTSASPTS